MATTLENSRGFLSRSAAALRAGVNEYGRSLDQEGPDIKVGPFDARNASTGAEVLKLATTMAAARRDRANFVASQKDADLKRELVSAHIGALRAEALYNEGLGRQTGGHAPGVLSLPVGKIPAGTDYGTANAILRSQTEDRAADAQRRAGKVRDARAALAEYDRKAASDVQFHANQRAAEWEPILQMAQSGSPEQKQRSNDLVLSATGVDLRQLAALQSYPDQQSRLIGDVRKRIAAMSTARAKANVDQYYAQLRAPHEATIFDNQDVANGAPAAPQESQLQYFDPNTGQLSSSPPPE